MNFLPLKDASALMITQDHLLYEQFASLLEDWFQMKLNRFTEEEVRNSLLYKKPLFVVWDGRHPSVRWANMVAWLRDYYHGLPILAVVDETDIALNQQLARMGVNQIIHCYAEGLCEILHLHILAILLDLQDQSNEQIEHQNPIREA